MIDMGRQWSDRLQIWSEQFDRHICRKCCALDTEFFCTMDHLTQAQAQARSFSPVRPGMTWGRKWEYGWFRADFTVPGGLDGQKLVLAPGFGPEMLVFVNGAEAGSVDRQHHEIILTRSAAAGTRYRIMAECYAGHGARNEGAGPVAYGEKPVSEPPENQVAVTETFIGVWNEAVYQAKMDYLTLYSLLKKLPDKSLRAMKVLEGLKQFTLTADFELPEPELTESVLRASEILKPLLACHNGSTAPVMTVFGQSHLDLAWLWPEAETLRKAARTYSNQLALMEEYGEYRFLLCEPPILEYLKKDYPKLFERVRQGVQNGRFYADGAVFVESDTNIPSGESLIRQVVWGKRWFLKELNTDSRVAWMPDTFGFSAALPQILKKCRVPYFATQKLARQDPEAEPFPYHFFWWEGLDGSRILAHNYKKNNAVFCSGELIARWEDDRVQTENIEGMLFPYGYGDGGGGPTRDMAEQARRCLDLEGAPRCRLESPQAFFDRQHAVKNVYKGELYLAWHRGTLTSQARTKRGIRKAEIALKIAEYHQARQLLDGKMPADVSRITALWETLLKEQFHDVAAGAGIERVHAEAEAALSHVKADAERMVSELLGAYKEKRRVYNHLGWDRLYRGYTVPAQSSVVVGPDPRYEKRAAACEDGHGFTLENEFLRCHVNGTGELDSLRLTGQEREFLAGPGNKLLLFKDVNTCYDAWEIGNMYEELPVALGQAAQISVCQDEDGAALMVVRKVHDSLMRQKIFLGSGAKRLDFITELDWHERHKLLKVAFPIAVRALQAAHEIQFGFVTRPTHASRQHDRDQYEVSNQGYTALYDGGAGAAVLNDCKYGVNVRESEIRLSLMRAPLMPDMNADQGAQTFTYSIYPFVGAFAQSGTARQAAELNAPLQFGSPERAQDGPIFLPEKENIVADTVKIADTVKNALLVRAYEAMGMDTVTYVRISGQVRGAAETNMLEENAQPLDPSAPVHFGPFEIKTFLLYLDGEGESDHESAL